MVATVEVGVGTRYITNDPLGSPRIVTSTNGTVISRHDYQPFGEELFTAGGRTTAQGYSVADGLRKQFTSKERDTETGLDYFIARYYSSVQGRFTSPDEFTGGPDELFDFTDDASDNPTFYADLTNPQSLNKYQYAYNNPLSVVDPDGHDPIPDPAPCCDEETAQNVAKGAAVGAVIGGVVGGTIGAVAEGGAGTFVAPGVGTVGGAADGAIKGTTIGVAAGAGIGAIIGYVTSGGSSQPQLQPAAPVIPLPQTGTPPSGRSQPMPPPPPAQVGHRKGKRKSTYDDHTKPRPGRPNTKDRQNPDWKPRQKPPGWPKGKPWPPWRTPQPKPKPKPKPDQKPEIGPNGVPVKP